jgi:hypothetical protein
MTYRVKAEDNKQLYRHASSALAVYKNAVKYALQEKYGFDIRYGAHGQLTSLVFKDMAHYIRFEKDSWREQYGIGLIHDNNGEVKFLDFQDEKHYIWFMLRWS